MITQSESSLEIIAVGKAWDIFSNGTIEVPHPLFKEPVDYKRKGNVSEITTP